MLSNRRPAPRLIDVSSAIGNPLQRSLFKLVEAPVEQVLGVKAINRIYADVLEEPASAERFFSTVLRVMGVQYELAEEERALVPTSGPVVVVANHPFGGLEGVILGDLLTRARPDARILGNHLLMRLPEIRPWIIPVDPFGGTGATQSNVSGVKECLRWLKGGGALGTFPAGAVSHLRLREGCISDPPWNTNIAALVRRTRATVVPVFFEGHNSWAFQLAGLVHPLLRTALLPSELARRAHTRLRVRVGRPIAPEKMARYEDDRTLTDYLRFKTYLLKRRRESPFRARFFALGEVPAAASGARQEPLGEAVPPETLAAEVAQLPADALLVDQGDFQVYVARAPQMRALLREIGRLREKTFREVSEGTGRAYDLDGFDDTYVHLFLWNRARSEVAGSYRLGRADELQAQRGVDGLYTSSLFRYRPGFLEQLGPALELGRSCIRAEYQRKPTSLALLWRGIGEYIARNPQYKVLFGPVSISREYHSLSRRLMVEFLGRHCGEPRLSGLVKPKNPPKEKLAPDERAVLEGLVKDAEDISSLVSEIEDDAKGMPVLLRHYLRLNARLLAFNVDHDFGSCIDGLIVVDLRITEPRILKRFMGEEGLRRFSGAAA